MPSFCGRGHEAFPKSFASKNSSILCQGEGSLRVFAKLAEEDRQLRLERERKGKEKGNDKEKGKHIDELKSKVKEARETVLSRRWAHGVVNNTNYS